MNRWRPGGPTVGLPARQGSDSRPPPPAEDQREHEQDHEDEQQGLGDPGEGATEPHEAEDAGGQGEDREDDGPVEYGMAFPFSNRNGAHHERGPRPPHRDEREVERRGMFSKRSSEWSVKSRSSLTWIDTPKTVEEEHGGPCY